MSNMYMQSGVNLDEAEKLNAKLSDLSSPNLNNFVGSVAIGNNLNLYNCCDGIGSKILPLYEKKLYKNIALDLIAANLNDMATQNVKAVAFSDYIAVHKLDSNAVAEIIKHLKAELLKCGCSLMGGETSEIPHLLQEGTIDICGFAIGLGEKNIPEIEPGDLIAGLCSSGIHANGFTLIRKLYNEKKLTDAEFESTLAPAFIYYNTVRKLWDNNLIKTGANITGGGIYANLKRIIPDNLKFKLNFADIPQQYIYKKLHTLIGDEIRKVFNCGVGFCVIAKRENFDDIYEVCSEYKPFILGEVL